jgi:hypothetical protein
MEGQTMWFGVIALSFDRWILSNPVIFSEYSGWPPKIGGYSMLQK